MKSLVIGLVGTALPLVAAAQVENYNIDPLHTFPHFELEHLGFAMLRGRFDKTAGKFTVDRAAKTGDRKSTRLNSSHSSPSRMPSSA